MINHLTTFLAKCILLSTDLYDWWQEWRREHYSYKFYWYQGRPFLDFFSLDDHIAILELHLKRYQKTLPLDLWLQLLFTELKKIPKAKYLVIGPAQRFFIQFAIEDGQYLLCLADWRTNDNKRMRRDFFRFLRSEGFSRVSAKKRHTDFGKYQFLVSGSPGQTDIIANLGDEPEQLANWTQQIVESCLQRSLRQLKFQILP